MWWFEQILGGTFESVVEKTGHAYPVSSEAYSIL